MYAKAGQAGVLIAHFVASGAAATGLTVTAKVWEITDANAKSPNDTTGTTATVTEIGGGAYKAPYTMGADGVPIAVFSTTGTADVKAVPASFVHLGLLDTIVTNIGDVHATDLPALKAVVDNIHDTDLPAVKTDTAAVKAKTDNLPASPAAVGSNMGTVASVTGAVGSVTGNVGGNVVGTVAGVTPYNGTPPTVGAIADAICDEALSGHTTAGTVGKGVADANNGTAPAAATVAAAVRTELTTELGRVDAAVSTRLATSGYTAPPSVAALATAAMLTDVQTDVDELQTSVAAIPTTPLLAANYTAPSATATLAASQPNYAPAKAGDSMVASNMIAAAPTADANATALLDNLLSGHITTGTVGKKLTDITNADLSGVATAASIAALPTDADVNAACDTAISDAAIPVAAATAVWGAGTKAVTSIPAVTGATLTSAYDAAKTAATQTSVNAIPTNPITSLTGIATATNVADAADEVIAALPDAAPTMITADAIADEVQTRTIARVTLVDTTTTNTDMRGTNSAITSLSGVSTFDPAIDTVLLDAGYDHAKDDVLTGIAGLSPIIAATDPGDLATALWGETVAENETAASALANAANNSLGSVGILTSLLDSGVTDVHLTASALENAPTGEGGGGDAYDDTALMAAVATIDGNVDLILEDTGTTLPAAISGLHDFDPATDTVARVTLVDTVTTLTNKTGFSGTASNMVAAAPTPAANATAVRNELATELARVDVATSTRLATSGYTAPPALTGLATEANATTNKNAIVSALPAAAPSAATVAAAILATPANKLATNSDGSVNATASVDIALIASDVVAAFEVAGIPTLSVIEGSTVLAKEASVLAISSFVDMTPVTEAIAAIPAPAVTVNPTVLDSIERAAISSVVNADLTTEHGFGAYGSATFAEGIVITSATAGTDGFALGRVMPYGVVTVYLAGDAVYKFSADADGDFSYELPVGSVWTLVARRSGYQDTEAAVSTEL